MRDQAGARTGPHARGRSSTRRWRAEGRWRGPALVLLVVLSACGPPGDLVVQKIDNRLMCGALPSTGARLTDLECGKAYDKASWYHDGWWAAP